jgi:carbon storage regulator CsrA
MLVLSSRVHEKIVLPGLHTSIEVVAIQPGTVRLGIEAPEEVRILRQGLPDRVAEWGPDPAAQADPPTLLQISQLLDRRLEVARKGLEELRTRLRGGEAEDAETLLDKLDEDLHLLRRRLVREVEKTAPASAAPSPTAVVCWR